MTQKIGFSGQVKSRINGPRTATARSQRYAPGLELEEGKFIRVKVLDYLGDGKLVVDLEGERVIANTLLSLEKNQEIDVLVRETGNRIVGISRQSSTDEGSHYHWARKTGRVPGQGYRQTPRENP